MKFIPFIFLLLNTSIARSEILSEGFSSTQYFSTGSLVLNITEGQLHPPLMIYQWQEAPAAATNTNINIGTGSNGTFTSASHYVTFSENGDTSGNIIRINTDTYSELNFTQFTLLAGWTIRPTGSKPLIIRVQGDVNIAGSINCNGSNGTDANISNLTMSPGGSGACGGGAGGNGGTSTTQPTQGSISDDQSGSISGGAKAASLSSTSGGGGGGGFTQPAYIAQDGYGPAAGTKGLSKLDGGFTIMGGGAGGGGGSANTRSGGGGGGGGGTILIHAYGNITISGTISANGGNGGSSTASASGSGGGGAGGSIWIFSGQNLTIDGTVTADNGTGGDSVNVGNHGDNGDGGHGASGRVWATDSLGGFGGAGSISPVSGLTSDGQARFQTGSFSRSSLAYDLLNYHIQFDSLTPTLINSGSGSFTATVEGSRRGFDLETTGPISSNSLSEVKNSRYVKLNVTLNNTSLTSPIKLDSIALYYSPSSPNEFNYKSSGCGSIQNQGGKSSLMTESSISTLFILIFFLTLPLWAWILKYYQLNSRPRTID